MTRVPIEPGFTLNVETAGSGPALVLLHGFTGSARAWGEFGERLAGHLTTIAVDIVGHGESDAPDDLEHYRMERAIEDIVTAVTRLGFERPHWLGYSMGGRTALQLANAYPANVRSLLTIGASPGIECVEDRVARVSSDELLARGIERDGVEAFIDYWEAIPLFASQRALPEAARARIREGRLRNRVTGLANSLRGMGAGAQTALHDRLATMTMPALIMAGALDTKYVETGALLAESMPNARFAAIPGAGHAAQSERPAEAAALVLDFIQTLESESPNG